MPEGVVTRALSGFFDVSDGDHKRTCRARGILRKRKLTILVGDRVSYEPIGVQEGIINDVLPRVVRLIRPPVANVDQIVAVCAMTAPEFQPYFLDRLLVSAELERIPAAIVLTKCDLVADELVAQLQRTYDAIGYPVIPTSSRDGWGIDRLMAVLKGKISVFAGMSGVGKSTLGNALDPELDLKIGELSVKQGRGKHTTRHTELFTLNEDTFIADAPGFSQLEFAIAPETLKDCFPEFVRASEGCAYRGCLHTAEESCAVKDAVETGSIASTRYESYRTLMSELKRQEETKY